MIDVKEVNPQRLRPRNKHVILHRGIVDSRNGIAVPQNSAEAWRWTVVAVADDVSGLAVGDVVWVTGQLGVNYAAIPNNRDLYIIDEKCVMIVIDGEREQAGTDAYEELHRDYD